MAKIGILVNGENPFERLARLKKEIAEKRARQTEEARQKKIQDALNSGSTIQNTPDGIEEKIGNNNTGNPKSDSEYFIAQGRFKIGDIKKVAGDYVFYDLELPMGYWKELTLQEALMPFGPRNFKQYEEQTARMQPIGVIPADAYYGLATVCFLNHKNLQLKDLIHEIKTKIFDPIDPNFDDQGFLGQYTSTKVHYIKEAPAIITTGIGWRPTHPFSAKYNARIASDPLILTLDEKDPKISEHNNRVLNALIGENDPQRAKKTLEWSMDKATAGIWVSDSRRDHIAPVIFRLEGNRPFIDAFYFGEDRPRYARGILADPKNYQKK